MKQRSVDDEQQRRHFNQWESYWGRPGKLVFYPWMLIRHQGKTFILTPCRLWQAWKIAFESCLSSTTETTSWQQVNLDEMYGDNINMLQVIQIWPKVIGCWFSKRKMGEKWTKCRRWKKNFVISSFWHKRCKQYNFLTIFLFSSISWTLLERGLPEMLIRFKFNRIHIRIRS